MAETAILNYIDPNVSKDIQKFGKADWSVCYHCGTCTATCSLTEDNELYPRKHIRMAQLGIKKPISESIEPWMCYYCGECSEKCPRGANPGEFMMTLRRYLISIYDWTGLSALMYKSSIIHFLIMLLLSASVITAFAIFAKIPVLSDPANVELNSFAPAHTIATLDHILLITLSFFLISNIINMYFKIIGSQKSLKIPFKLAITELRHLIIHFITQLRFSKCDRKTSYWISHLLLMTSYTLMFILIIGFLEWFQTDEIHPVTHPQRWIGYYITFGVIVATVYYLIGRLRRKQEVFRFSHHSDWYFIILLFLIAVTGILIHIFRLNGMAKPTYYAYVAHLAVEVPMVVTFVAFSKWSHIAYRPFAIYFSNLKKSAMAQ